MNLSLFHGPWANDISEKAVGKVPLAANQRHALQKRKNGNILTPSLCRVLSESLGGSGNLSFLSLSDAIVSVQSAHWAFGMTTWKYVPQRCLEIEFCTNLESCGWESVVYG